MRKIALMSAVAAIALMGTAVAQTPPAASPVAPSSSARVRSAPVLDYLRSQGVDLVSIGEVGGLEGYLSEAPGGRRQVFYVSPDGTALIAGVAFDARGSNLTGPQIDSMRRRTDAERARLDEERRRAEEAARSAIERARDSETRSRGLEAARDQFSGGLGTGAPNAPTSRPATPAPAAEPTPPPAAPSVTPAPAPAPTPAPAAALPPPPPAPPSATEVPTGAPVTPSAPRQGASADRFVSPLNQAEVLAAAENLPWIRLGRETAPALYFMADPQCPFCHAAWAELRPRIVAGEISVRLILIGALPGSRDQVISILARGNDAGRAWLLGEGSKDGVAVQPPPARESQQYRDAEAFMNANNAFAVRFELTQTPWLAYKGADGRLFSKFGATELPAFLENLPRPGAAAPAR